TAQVVSVLGDPDAVIAGQLLQRTVAQAVNTRIANMEQVGRGGFEQQHAQGTHVTAITVVAVLALPGLGMQPGIDRHQHTLRRGLYRPGLRGAEIVGEEPFDAGFTGDLADRAATDTVGQGDGNTLGGALRLGGQAGTVEILVDGFATLVGVLAGGNGKLARHGGSGFKRTGSGSPELVRYVLIRKTVWQRYARGWR